MITGSCFCGKIQYEYHGDPLFQLICCCSDCQKATGSNHVPVIGANKEQFVVKGLPKSFVSIGGSGKNAVRHFCSDCGSLLFGTPESDANLVTIYAGTVDGGIVFKPGLIINAKSKPEWVNFGNDLKTFEGMP